MASRIANAGRPPQVRLLIGTAPTDDTHWSEWQAARDGGALAERIVMQRISRCRESLRPQAVGVGYAEQLCWFGPIDSPAKRQLILEYARGVLRDHEFPPVDAELSLLVQARPGADGPDATTLFTETVALTGIVLLSHADTDLLALERARQRLPAEFPAVIGHSLVGLADEEALYALLGPCRSSRLCVIVRIHGAVSSVPGLMNLVALAQRERWSLVVISGVGGGADLLPRSADVTTQSAASLTAYFMAGGSDNVAHALRRAAAEYLACEVSFNAPREMPAHGLYHPDLLVTDPEEWQAQRRPGAPLALVVFYRAHVLSGNLEFVDCALRALETRGFSAVGVFTSSLRDRGADAVPLALRLLDVSPDVIVNTVNFPVFALSALERAPPGLQLSAFEQVGAPLLQAICCGTARAVWRDSARGLSPTEAAINIALPECDGRVTTVPVSFKEKQRYVPDPERLRRVAGLAHRMATLRTKGNADKRIAIVLSNAGGKAQRIGGAVGLDTPASLLSWLVAMRGAGYTVGALPDSADALMACLLAQGCYDERHPMNPASAQRLPRAQYARWFEAQSEGFKRPVVEIWGRPASAGATIAAPAWRSNKQALQRSLLPMVHELYCDDEDYFFSGLQLGHIFVAIQPPRGFGVDPEAVYHAPDLPPCHHYVAFYRWLTEIWGADALLHFGTHGTLEWLPGKSVALSADCAPDVLLGELPLVYPFVVNNPGEGAQAKRRTHAVIIDHLVPPLTQAGTYGPLATLARLVEEYYRAELFDTNKLPVLRRQVWELVRTARLEDDLQQISVQRHGDHQHRWDGRLGDTGIPRSLENLSGRGFAHLLEDLDAYLCDLGRAQIRGGLHVFGAAPHGPALLDFLFAILRSPNGNVPSLPDAVACACGIDPIAMRAARGLWSPALPPALEDGTGEPVTVTRLTTRIEDLARALLRTLAAHGFSATSVTGVIAERFTPPGAPATGGMADLARALRFACEELVPHLARTTDETGNLLRALDGDYVPAGPSGSPSRGMAHVLPTGRNFYTVDPRSLPTPAAWSIGSLLAREAVARYVTKQGRWPESIALSIWGTPTLRTGGDDVAQALALLGVRPIWEPETRRPCDLEVVPLLELGRPRIDVTLRVSGFFRDAFPGLMQLFDAAVQRVMHLDEPSDQNFVRRHWLAETATRVRQGTDLEAARRLASYRVFSSKPGAYGTGLAQLMDGSDWRDSADLARAFVSWGGWAYSSQSGEGVEAVEPLRRRLSGIELVLHNQDNQEQDLLDSTDTVEFQGGLICAVAAIAAATPQAYCGDSSNASRPVVRTLQGEALRVFRSRVVNPKWLDAMQRHGFRGGLEMAATVDALFGFAATAGIVTDWMFEGIAENFADGRVGAFLRRANPWALNAIVERLLEAEQRGLWTAEAETLARLRGVFLESETVIEAVAENSP